MIDKRNLLVVWMVLGAAGLSSSQLMKCTYGERGSLTATCTNATSAFFRSTSYRFDSLDETVRCVNCNLDVVDPNSFDISGNQILSLDLRNSKIVSLRESSFVGLVFLKNLYLQDNQIKNIFPGIFRGIKKVVDLQLSNNSLSMLIANGFQELANLTTLNLEYNFIKSIDSQAFNGLGALQDLNLGHNKLVEVKDVFNNLPKIVSINLEFNEIASINSFDISNLTSLINLNLAQNKIKTLNAHAFITLHNLVNLDLSFNGIEDLGARTFDGLNSLEVLDLQANNLNKIEKGAFLGLTQLRDLNLARNHLRVFKTGLFSGLPEMRYLNLSENNIIVVLRTGIMYLHSLHTLDLSFNNLTDLDYKILYRHMPRVTFMDLVGNNFPCYLIAEMDEYFADDNIKLSVEGLLRNNSCLDVRPKEVVVPEELYEDEPTASYAHSYVVYPMFVVVLLAVVYLVYKVEIQAKYGQGQHRTISTVNLMNEVQTHD